MKFSIITASSLRDSKRLIELESNLEAQSEHDFEWVVACNQPRLKFPVATFPIKYVTFSPNTLGAAMNRAVQVASGAYLIFVDADDYLTINAVKNLSAVLQHSDAHTVIDLNDYYTYEPKNIFVNSIRKNNSNLDALPQTPYKINNFHPVCREFNYSESLLKSFNGSRKYSNWLADKYWRFAGRHLYDDIERDLTVAGKVIPKALVQQTRATFSSTNRLYPNFSFMVSILAGTRRILKLSNYHYILVGHNDPINDPSLDQLNSNHRWADWLKACLGAVRILDSDDNHPLKRAFTQFTVVYLHRYFYKAVAMELRSVGSVRQDFRLLSRYLDQLNREAYALINPLSKHVLTNVAHHHFKLARRKMSLLVASRDVHDFISDDNQTAIYESYRLLFRHLPVNPKVIIYESFIGRSYADNPKYIYLYIQKHYPNRFIHVWIADDENYDKIKRELKSAPNTIVVRKFGFEYMYYLATSKYQIFNMRQPKWFVKRPGTTFIETWHGTPLKRLVFDLDNIANAPLYKKGFYYQTKQWDHLLTDNPFSYDVFSHAFMYPKSKMLKTGYPRNDILSSPDRDRIAKNVKLKLGIPLDKKVILYAPTWRDDQYLGAGKYNFQLKLNLAKMKRVLGDHYVFILRTHYFVTNQLNLSAYGNFVFNESGYDDISELYLISDLLITDYSSVFFDYANLRRPILYFAYDYAQYSGVLRGFYLDMKRDLPGPILTTSDQVLSAILNIRSVEQKYRSRYRAFNRRFNSWDDGHAAKRAVNTILKRD